MVDHVANILQLKSLLLWRKILVELGYQDIGVIDELATGIELVGEAPCGVFEKAFKASEITVESLAASSNPRGFSSFMNVDRLVTQKWMTWCLRKLKKR